ncbi:MAG TPA: M28 family metallopeptidase [Allosphingosinicella sp.]|jgi:Zn-dependent M28 family amino/carboxypeptidase
MKALLAAALSLFAAAALTACAASDDGPRATGAAAAEVDAARLSEHTRILASDAYGGRAMGTDGEERTVRYIIEQFAAAGLEPGGENGGWTQAVPLVRTRVSPEARFSIAQAGETVPLRFPEDVYMTTVRSVEAARIAAAPMVFVGYGVSAPERGWDDFRGVDLTGKVAVFLVNDPDFEAAPGEPAHDRFGGQAMTYYGRWSYKFEEAARRGAVAALVVHETEGAGYGWNVVQSPGGENYNIVLPEGAQQPVLLQGWIQRPAAEALFRRAGLDFERVRREARSGSFRPVDLRATFTAETSIDLARIMSRNVIGKLTGRTRANESVMFAGHWDSFGMGPPDAEGRRMRPGAVDDAIGIAGLIELGRVFAAGPRPERTMVFAAWTAEERGLLGAEHYSQNPLYPLETTAANLTMDVLQTAGAARDVVLIGRGQSEMEDLMAEAAAAQGRTVTPESHPERGLFFRADHFALARRGVPPLLIMALAGGNDLLEGGRQAGERWVSDYTTNCYHQPCDAWSADWDLAGALQDVNLIRAIGWRLADSRAWPAWREGSEFAAVRARTAAARR